MRITNKDIGWGIIFGTGLGYFAGWWALPIALVIFVICAICDELIGGADGATERD